MSNPSKSWNHPWLKLPRQPSSTPKKGWDSYTFLAVFADLSNAVSSALVFRRLSAVAKYVCRASSAVPWWKSPGRDGKSMGKSMGKYGALGNSSE
jgi:hypothetical protein